jgi:hypothetical protein
MTHARHETLLLLNQVCQLLDNLGKSQPHHRGVKGGGGGVSESFAAVLVLARIMNSCAGTKLALARIATSQVLCTDQPTQVLLNIQGKKQKHQGERLQSTSWLSWVLQLPTYLEPVALLNHPHCDQAPLLHGQEVTL